MTQAQASAEVPIIKIMKEDSSIRFHVKASVAIDVSALSEARFQKKVRVSTALWRAFRTAHSVSGTPLQP
jgi:hypothetical protein